MVQKDLDTSVTKSFCKRTTTAPISVGRKITSASASIMNAGKKIRPLHRRCAKGGEKSFTSKLMHYKGGNHQCGNFKVEAFQNSVRGEY